MTKANAIFLCDGGMKLPGKLATAVEGQTMKKTFEKPRSVAATLLHEMLHLIQDLDDVSKIAFPDKESDEPEWENKEQRIPKRQDKAVCGYLAPYHLARYVPDDALKTVQTFVWFAMSVYQQDWKFEAKEGTASKMGFKT